MKTKYLILLFFISTTLAISQNNDFTNGDGDLLWSNSANWSQGVVLNPPQLFRQFLWFS